MDEKLLVDIHILLVDDDATSLAVVSAMLRLCKYQVVSLKNPIEALDTLRARKGFFDLVVTDLHMPQMNGLQLQKKVRQEFKLPVIMMSADEKPSVILKSLEEGVAFYMVKPISLDDVKHVWQYAFTPNQITTTIIRPQLSINKSSSSKEINRTKSSKSKNKKANQNRAKKNSTVIRKAKVIWTNSLHNRFLQAIKLIGLHKAVPKKILEFMNVPGLTRENVASHLQKYRIFLKRVAEKGAHSMQLYSDYTLLRTSFASPHFQFQSPLNTSKPQSQHSYFLHNQRLMAPSNYQYPILGENKLSHLTPLPNPNLEGPSMENALPHLEKNQKHSSLLTLNILPDFPFNGLVSSSTQDDQKFVSMENENARCLSNGLCNDLQTPHDLNNNGGMNLDNNNNNYGEFSGSFEGKHQNLLGISNKNMEENGSVLVSSEEWKAANDTIAFGDIGEHQNCFDVLSVIFMGHNHNQTSLRKEEMDDYDIWNGIIEMDASTKQDVQPSGLSAQGWDDDILEMFLRDGSSSSNS